MAGLESMIVDEKQAPPKQVDREKTCPLLLRVFCNTGRHHSVGEYAHGEVPSNELQIYTWQDATLRELTTLVRDVNPDTRRKGTFFDFALVYMGGGGGGRQGNMDRNGYQMKEIGVTCSGQKGADDLKTLSMCKFVIGDFLDISITPPNRIPPNHRRPRY